MNPSSDTNLVPVSPPAEDEINLLDLLMVIAKHKMMILKVTFSGALLSIIIAMLMAPIYTSTAKILPPQSNQSSSVNALMLGQLGGLAGAAGSSLGLKDPNAIYIAMLKSRNIGEKIVQRFDLQTVYEQKTMMETLKALEKASTITSGKDGVISVEVDDKDAKRAADLANGYIEELNKLMQTFALTEASGRRHFFEGQIKPYKDKLTDAEVALDRTPSTSLQYMDALRKYKSAEGIYQLIANQFAAASLDEAKDAPLIQVLDKATIPEKKSKPKRALIVILTTLVALFLAVIGAFVRESMSRAEQQPEQAKRLNNLRNAFKFKA